MLLVVIFVEVLFFLGTLILRGPGQGVLCGCKSKAESPLDAADAGLPVCRRVAAGTASAFASFPSPTKMIGIFVVVTQVRVRPQHLGDCFKPLSLFVPTFWFLTDICISSLKEIFSLASNLTFHSF